MTQIEAIKHYAKDLSVLYAEDDMQTQKAMKSILAAFFKHVYVANDGQEGAELFKNHHPDMVLSDITMPHVNGLEMVRVIRGIDQEIPVMIITAYSDTSYLLDSIFLGIDRYVTKPLNEEEFFKNLLVLLKGIHQKREALAYQKARTQAQINEAALGALKETADIYPSPTFVFDEAKKLMFLNNSASKMFSQEELSSLLEDACVDGFVVKKQGFMESIHEASPAGHKDQKIILKTNGATRIFLLNKAQLRPSEHPLTLFSLTDITRVEYEKQKSQNLSAYLHDVLRQARKEPLAQPTVAPQTSLPKAPPSYEHMRLSAMHAVHKESAQEYIASLSSEVMDELQEMEELEKEMGETFMELEEHFNLSSLHSVARHFQRYGKMIGYLMDFADVAYSLHNLSEFLLGLMSAEFNQQKMLILLQAVSEDLANWRQTIFVNQATNDIHYLDASLLSSCLQIKMDFGEGEAEGEELELF
ncbi:MAG: response regulator [Campylobacterales bacterium]|nr:response regulator [Campylobacterales bacterium]